MDDAGQPGSDFPIAARQAFDAPCASAGLRCVESRPDRIRYESPAVFFEIGYAVDHDREVYARIGRIGQPGVSPGDPAERLDFGLYLAVADPAGYAEFSRAVPYSIAGSREQLRRVLSYFAAGVGTHGLPLLVGDAEAFSRARELRFWHLLAQDAESSAAADRGGIR